MKTWKLVSGILSIILFVVVSFQSCAVGIGNTLGETGEVGGSGGIVLSILMLAGGIVSIATRNTKGKGGNIFRFCIGRKLYRLENLGGMVFNQCYFSSCCDRKK